MSSLPGAVKPFAIAVQPLERGAATKQVIDQLRGLIARGELAAGERLPAEPQLAGAFGVSRSVIREAIRVLTAQGFVLVRQGSGTTVTDSSNWKVFDPDVLLATQRHLAYTNLIDARRLLEPALAARAAERRTQADLARIREMLSDEIAVVDEHVRIDLAFHRRIAEAAGNPVLVILLDSIGVLLREHRRELYSVPGSAARALALHHAIYNAIAAGDAKAAETEMSAHLDQVEVDFASLQRQ
jgi:GntR family transcriptional repressor for pyruvate dehydrogenase complex